MKNTIPVLLSDRLQTLRKLHQLSLSKFARNINVSKSMIFNFENQVTLPSVEVLTKISNYFCCSMDYLVGRSDNLYWMDYLPQAEEIFFNHPNTSKNLIDSYKHDKATHPIELAPVFLRNYESIRDNDNQK
jgi:transcriptional regulator with XRE-family HTH domain